MTNSHNVAVIGGDGIGPEVTDVAIPVIEAAAGADGSVITWNRLPYGADHFLATGETLPDSTVAELSSSADAILVGALGDPRVPDGVHARDILLGLRFKLDLYINFRPCHLLLPSLCPLRSLNGAAVNFVIFRENTEGSYLGRGTSRNVGGPDEEQIVEAVHTAPKIERIIRAAFEWARANGKRRVTMSDKSNAIPGHRVWGRIFAAVGAEFPEIEREHRYVDALAMEIVRSPDRFEVIVTSNLFGDILSDLGAEIVGGMGLAPSANLHPGRAGLFEPVHGSAPPLVGTGKANPMATLLTGALLLDDLGAPTAGGRIRDAVRQALIQGVTTPDLGGSATTEDVGRWVERRITSG